MGTVLLSRVTGDQRARHRGDALTANVQVLGEACHIPVTLSHRIYTYLIHQDLLYIYKYKVAHHRKRDYFLDH